MTARLFRTILLLLFLLGQPPAANIYAVGQRAPHNLSNVTLVPVGATWKYLDDGSNQGTAWTAITFDDSAWPGGAAQLGYGDGDETTTVGYGGDSSNKYISTYFRRVFTVSNPADFASDLSLRLLRDDGAVVYLNGTEVVRDNMPAGSITYTTPAVQAIGLPVENSYFNFTVSASHLISGTNVLAVEIHQANPTSSDISFDLQLSGVSLAGACTNPGIRFAVVGDYGLAGQAEADVAALVDSWNPDFITTVGDNNYNLGEASTIDANIGQYFHQYIGHYSGGYGPGAASNNFYPAPGNHDWYSPDGLQPYLDYFTLPGNERYYTFTRGPVQFFMLDSDANEPDGITSTSTQAAWLQTQLANSTAPWKLVHLHHAPYSSAKHGSQTTLQWPYRQWGASAVLAGHDHTYERLFIDGLPYFVNGLGGKSLYSFGTPVAGSHVRYRDDYGAMLVEASDTCLTFQFINRQKAIIDTFTQRNDLTPQVYLPVILRNSN